MMELKYMAPSPQRGVTGIICILSMFVGSSMLWGIAAALLIVGLVVYLDTATDEAIERITGIRRGAP